MRPIPPTIAPGHGADHRDQRDAAIESAVPGDLRNAITENDVQCHQQRNGHDQRLEHGRRIAAPPTKYPRGEHPGLRSEPRERVLRHAAPRRGAYIAEPTVCDGRLPSDATDIIAA